VKIFGARSPMGNPCSPALDRNQALLALIAELEDAPAPGGSWTACARPLEDDAS